MLWIDSERAMAGRGTEARHDGAGGRAGGADWHVAFGLEGPLLFVVAYVRERPAVERLIALVPVTACFWTLTVARQAQAAYVYWQSYVVFYTRTFPPANDRIFQRSVLPPFSRRRMRQRRRDGRQRRLGRRCSRWGSRWWRAGPQHGRSQHAPYRRNTSRKPEDNVGFREGERKGGWRRAMSGYY